MIKVAYVVPLLAPYAIPRYQELAKISNVEVHVIIERDTYEERAGWKYQEIEGVYTYFLNSKSSKPYEIMNKNDGYKMNKIRFYPTGLKKLLNKIKPNIVLVCNSTQIAFIIGRRRNYKLGVVVEDTLRAAEGRRFINAKIKQLLLKQADFYIPFTTDAEEFLKYNGINGPYIHSTWSMDTEKFSDLIKSNAVKAKKKELGLSSNINYILVANLIPRKGITQFLGAWSMMSNEFNQSSELYILGDGPLRKDIDEFIIKKKLTNVHVIGSVSYQSVSHYLQCGDVFVLPTLEDLCSLAVLEAMAAGLPILTTIYNGAREFVCEGENGFIFDPLDSKSVIDALNKVYKADLSKLSHRSLELVSLYSHKNVQNKLAKDLMNLYKIV